MNLRRLATGLFALSTALGMLAVQADSDSAGTHAVTATPPVQVVPATPPSKNVQQRMRACNAGADARKLQNTPRETFIKSCMASHHSHPLSRPGSQPKANP
jgi:hypothetical protein